MSASAVIDNIAGSDVERRNVGPKG